MCEHSFLHHVLEAARRNGVRPSWSIARLSPADARHGDVVGADLQEACARPHEEAAGGRGLGIAHRDRRQGRDVALGLNELGIEEVASLGRRKGLAKPQETVTGASAVRQGDIGAVLRVLPRVRRDARLHALDFGLDRGWGPEFGDGGAVLPHSLDALTKARHPGRRPARRRP